MNDILERTTKDTPSNEAKIRGIIEEVDKTIDYEKFRNEVCTRCSEGPNGRNHCKQSKEMMCCCQYNDDHEQEHMEYANKKLKEMLR